jgi:hypothetical protein
MNSIVVALMTSIFGTAMVPMGTVTVSCVAGQSAVALFFVINPEPVIVGNSGVPSVQGLGDTEVMVGV